MERLIGANIFISISVEGVGGFDKGIFIQAKYDRNIDRADLKNACGRMMQDAGREGAYVWIYQPDGVKVISSHQVREMQNNSLENVKPRSAEGFFGRVLDCNAGSRKWGILSGEDRRKVISDKLREVRVKNLLDIQLKKSKSLRP